MASSLSSQKPYFIRAVFDWLMDNNLTPHLSVDASYPDTQIPDEYVNDGKIVMNIAADAVRNFHVDNDWISFSARFGGKPMEIFIPIAAVMGIYAQENNEGLFFTADTAPAPEPPTPTSDTKKAHKLTVVK